MPMCIFGRIFAVEARLMLAPFFVLLSRRPFRNISWRHTHAHKGVQSIRESYPGRRRGGPATSSLSLHRSHGSRIDLTPKCHVD